MAKYFCRVEYLESTGTQWIDAGVTVNTSTDEIKLYFELTETQNYKWFFGEYDNNSRLGLGSGDGANKRNFLYQQSATKVSDTQMYNTQHLFEINSNGGFLDGTKIRDYLSFTSTSSIYLFNLNIDSSSDYRCKSKIWKYEHKRNGVLIKELVPVLDNNGRPAMYDNVSGQLFYNQGTGEFNVGRQIHPVEYLESTGGQYIDTGIQPTDEYGYRIRNTYAVGAGEQCAIGCMDAGNRFVGIYTGGSQVSGGWGSFVGYLKSPYSFTDDTIWDVSCNYKNDRKIILNNEELKDLTDTNISGTINNTIYLFARHYGSNITKMIGKIYGAEITNGQTVVADYIPCIDENLVPFMFDLVNCKIYENAGTGQFKVGKYLEQFGANKKLLRKKYDMMLSSCFKKKPYYCEVEYLEATGTQYINTGLISTANSKVDVVFGFTSMASGAAENCAIFGGRNNTTVTTFTLFKLASGNPQYFRFDYNGQKTIGTASNLTWDTTSKYRFTYDGLTGISTNITTGESDSSAFGAGSSFTSTPIALFAVNTNGTYAQNMKGRIYKYWYTDGTNTIDLIPVLDWNMTPCMYDKISGKLFYNQGTGTFQYGREIHEVEYIESTGLQCIDTGIKLTNDHSVELDYQLTQASQSRAGLFGALNMTGSNQGRFGSILSPSNQQLEHGYGAGNDYWQQGLPDTNRHKLYQKKNEIYFDGNLIHTFNTATFNLAINAYLGNFAYTNYTPAKAKYYSSKWWNNNTLVRDYTPAIDENGAGFMFDKVTHTIFDNAGTDAFKYSARETEYIEVTNLGTNNQNPCIDLGLKYKPSMSIESKYTRTDMGVSGSVLPLSNSTTQPLIYMPALNASAKTDRFVWRRSGLPESSYYYDFANYPMTVEFKVDAVNDVLTVNGNVVKTGMIASMNGYESPYESDSNLYMLSINGTYGGMGKVYYLKLYDTTQVYRDLIPVWKDGVVCMYDKQNNVYYSNFKTGTVICGKIIEKEWEEV